MSKKNFFLLFFIQLALLASLSSFGFFKDFNKSAEEEKLIFSSTQLSQLREISILSSLPDSPKESLRLKKTKKGPWFVANKKELADEREVRKFVQALADLTQLSSFPLRQGEGSQKEIKSYGLDDEKFSIKLKGPDLSQTLKIGSKSQISSRRFASLQTTPVSKSNSLIFVLDEGRLNSLMKKSFDFRKKQPVNFQEKEIKKIVLKKGIKESVLVKDSNTDWKFSSESTSFPVSATFIEEKLSSWKELTAIDIIDSKTEKFDYFPEVLKVFLYSSLEGGAEPTESIVFGEKTILEESKKPLASKDKLAAKGGKSPKKYFYFRLKDSFPVYSSASSTYREFLKPEELLREKKPFNKLAKLIKEIKISGTSLSDSIPDTTLSYSKNELLEALKLNEAVSPELGVLMSLRKMQIVSYFKDKEIKELGFQEKEPELEFEFNYFSSFDDKNRIKKLSFFEDISSSSSQDPINQDLAPSYALLYSSNVDKFHAAIVSAGEKKQLLKIMEILQLSNQKATANNQAPHKNK